MPKYVHYLVFNSLKKSFSLSYLSLNVRIDPWWLVHVTFISLYEMDLFAASMIMLETLSAISSTLFVADKKLQSFSLRSRLYLL